MTNLINMFMIDVIINHTIKKISNIVSNKYSNNTPIYKHFTNKCVMMDCNFLSLHESEIFFKELQKSKCQIINMRPTLEYKNIRNNIPVHSFEDINIKIGLSSDEIEQFYNIVDEREINCIMNFMEKQEFLTCRIYEIFIKQLIKIARKIECEQNTLFMATYLFNKFLMIKKDLNIEDINVISITCLWISYKYEENDIYSLSDYIVICGNICSIQTIKTIEINIVLTVEFDLLIPTPYTYFYRYVKAGKLSHTCIKMSNAILLKILPFSVMTKYLPSKIMASVIYMVITKNSNNLHNELWSNSLIYYTKYNVYDLDECVNVIKDKLEN